jgi:hypothetical protein
MNVQTIESTTDHVLATWENIGIIVWRKESTVRAVKLCIDVLKEHQMQVDTDLLMVTVIESDAILPELSVRLAIMESLRQAQGVVCRSGVFVAGDGFKAVSKRAVISGILVFTKLNHPHKVFGNLGSLSKFLIGPNGKIPPHILMRAIEITRHSKIEP